MKWKLSLFLILSIVITSVNAQTKRVRDYGISPGVLKTGKFNAITDVEGVRVGQVTLWEGDSIRTGITAIIPHRDNIFLEKVPAAIYIGNGFGKLMGYSQVEELGNIETPIILTNTLSVPTAANALIDYTLALDTAGFIRSVNPIVGETNDGYLNDIRGRHVQKTDILEAIKNAKSGKVEEGCVGAGTGTRSFGYKAGIGTSSRKLPKSLGGYTIGVLVQANFGGVLQIDGVPFGEELGKYYLKDKLNENPDGSCMIVIATNAPLDARNLKRLAKRAMLGLAKTGGIASNGSGDYVIAFSTAKGLRVPYFTKDKFYETTTLHNDHISPIFMATIEATEEAILNSLFAAEDTQGFLGRTIKAMPIEEVLEIMKKYGRL